MIQIKGYFPDTNFQIKQNFLHNNFISRDKFFQRDKNYKKILQDISFP